MNTTLQLSYLKVGTCGVSCSIDMLLILNLREGMWIHIAIVNAPMCFLAVKGNLGACAPHVMMQETSLLPSVWMMFFVPCDSAALVVSELLVRGKI